MARYRGRSFFRREGEDGGEGETIHNDIEVTQEAGRVEIRVAGADGTTGGRPPLTSTDLAVRNWHHGLTQEAIRQNGRMRPPNPVPKTTVAPSKKYRAKGAAPVSGGCPRCGGAGEYEWTDGFMRPCPLCQPIQGDEDLSSLQ